MDYHSYLDSLRGKRIGVIGFGVSNQPLVEALLNSGCDVTICDKREMDSLGEAGRNAADRGAKFCLGEDYLEHLDYDLIYGYGGPNPYQISNYRRRVESRRHRSSESGILSNLYFEEEF